MELSKESSRWLEEFRAKYGRAPRILHIGNIANNAYNNAKLLNEAGLDCDVICYDYYHIMGCPEWEDADFSGDFGDQYKPDWVAAGVNGFGRPRWFAQGPLFECINYLVARREGRFTEANNRWSRLSTLNGSRLPMNSGVLGKVSQWTVRLRQLFNRIGYVLQDKNPFFDARAAELISNFTVAFSSRSDKLSSSDLDTYRLVTSKWRELFNFYDLVQAYSTDPILPLLTGNRYIAFEHGTIRNIPYENTTQGRLCALSYRLSNWTVVTNADNMNSARRIGIPNFTFVPHPVTEDGISDSNCGKSLRESLLEKLNANFLIFHPSRQHWSEERHPDWEKGNDFFLEGFSRFVHEVESRAVAVLVDWGASIQHSRELIDSLGIKGNVFWVPPMSHRLMTRYILASDLVADQFYLGAFGSTLPKALLCGRVSLLYLNPDIHTECFNEMPPVLNARSSEQIFLKLSFAYGNKKEMEKIQEDGKQWYQNYHSNKAIAEKLISIYSNVLNDFPELQG